MVGIPSCPSAAPAGGHLEPSEVEKALDYMRFGTNLSGRNYTLQNETHPNLRGVMTWSINWDASASCASAYEFSNSYSAYFNENVTQLIYGCTDIVACNYDASATSNDNSCEYAEDNYNCDGLCINDTDSDGICDEEEISGCTDNELACNYNSEATDHIDCVFPTEYYNCDGECINDNNGNSICDELEILGCTDVTALNYNSEANVNDGSCIYDEENENCSISVENQYIDLYLPQGWVYFGFTCLEPIDVSVAFDGVTDKITIVKDSDGNVYLPIYNHNTIGDLVYSRGYQLKTLEEITNFSFCATQIITYE